MGHETHLIHTIVLLCMGNGRIQKNNIWLSKFRESVAANDKGGLAVQACDEFLDELLSHKVGGDGRLPDIRCFCHHCK